MSHLQSKRGSRTEERDMIGDIVNEIKLKQAEIMNLKQDFQMLLMRKDDHDYILDSKTFDKVIDAL